MYYSKEKPSCSTFRAITANFRVSEILGFLRCHCMSGLSAGQYYRMEEGVLNQGLLVEVKFESLKGML